MQVRERSCKINTSQADRIELEIPIGVLHSRSPIEIPRKLDANLYELYIVWASLGCITIITNENHKE